MAKETKTKTTTAAKAATEKKRTTKATTKEQVKKLTAAKEPEKITAKEEPKKLTAKEEPKKLATSEAKTAEKKSAAKKTTAKKAAAKTTAAKKETAKTVKAAEAEKATVKEEKPAKKTVAKKATTKKTAAVKKTTKKAKLAAYESWSLEDCIARMQEMNVQHAYEDYARFLLDEADMKKIEKNIVEGNGLDQADFDYDKNGFDKDLVAVTLQKVADTMDLRAADFKVIKKDIEDCIKTTMGSDGEANAAEYLKEFNVCEKILMIGQRRGIHQAAEVSELLGAKVEDFIEHFFTLAYDLLPSWQYDDVKFYEDFTFAVLSQYHDLYEAHQLRILLDVADLYIKHGDFQHGDECYGYILRDNQIKDYIYYRFASVYESIDINKAKSLAYESLQYVDGRYTYYQNIMDIIHK